MTTDIESAVAADSTDPTTLAAIPEVAKDADAPASEEMELEEEELVEKPILTASYIIIRIVGNDKQINVAFLLKSVIKWLFDIDPSMYLETANPDWKTIKSIDDFPTKEVDFMKCFDPSTNKGGNKSVTIGIHLFSSVSVGLMKKNNNSFLQYLSTKKISLGASCGGSKNEVLLFGLLGFNPDKTHRVSLRQQIHDQLLTIAPDLAEKKLLEKVKSILPFEGSVPGFDLQTRWVNAEAKKYTAKAYGISCAAEHADYFRSFLLRSYFEKKVIGLGKLVQLGGRSNHYLPKAITWHNNFVEECAIVGLLNISKQAMDQPFNRKKTASTEETTSIRRILLSATEGKAVNLYESRDVDSAGRWIVGIEQDKVEHLTVVVATTISKLYENGQIIVTNQLDEAPAIDQKRKVRRKSNESGVSGFDDDDTSIQSMHSKAWSSVAMGDSGSVPKASTNRAKPKIHFVYDPESTEEFPALVSTTAPSPRNDTSSVGSTSTVTTSQFEAFQSKLTKDMADNLKACQNSLISSVTADSNQSSVLEEMRAERLAMAKENQAARQQQTEMNQQLMSMFMQFQQLMSGMMNGVPPQSYQQGPMPFQGPPIHFDQRQAPPPQQQQPPHPTLSQQQQQELIANHQQIEHQLVYAQQQAQYRQQQQHAQQSPQRSQQLFKSTPPPQQHQHYSPEQHQPDLSGYFQGNGQASPPSNQIKYSPQQHTMTTRYPEEQVDFEQQPHAHNQLAVPQQLKRAPGGAGQTFMTPAKKKTAGTNASSEYYASAPDAILEDSPSEGAGGVQ